LAFLPRSRLSSRIRVFFANRENRKKHRFDFEAEFTRLGRATGADEILNIRDAAEVERMRARLSGDTNRATLAADIVRRANERLTSGKGQRRGWVPLHLLGKSQK
jgi:hypothetical protein